MKNFFYVTAGQDIHIPNTVSSGLNTWGVTELKGEFIYYVDDSKVRNLPNGSGSLAIINVFGNDTFNTLCNPITITGILSDVASGTTDDTWYLVSASGSNIDDEYKNTLLWYGTTASIAGGTAAPLIGQKFLRPFTGLTIAMGGTTNYEWNCVERTDNRWKRIF